MPILVALIAVLLYITNPGKKNNPF